MEVLVALVITFCANNYPLDKVAEKECRERFEECQYREMWGAISVYRMDYNDELERSIFLACHEKMLNHYQNEPGKKLVFPFNYLQRRINNEDF